MAWLCDWKWWSDVNRKWHSPEEGHLDSVYVEEAHLDGGGYDRIFIGHKSVGSEPCGPGVSLTEAFQQNEWRIGGPA
jgi:hypothetical protein